jgi:hypothetical protein
MLSQLTMRTWPNGTFSAASLVKWARASGDSADLCGPHATASHISSLDHGHPVCVGHPNVAHSMSRAAAGWDSALPWGHIELKYRRPSGGSGGIVGLVVPLCIAHCELVACIVLSIHRRRLFSLRSTLFMSPRTLSPVSSSLGGHRPSILLTPPQSRLTSHPNKVLSMQSGVTRLLSLPCPP